MALASFDGDFSFSQEPGRDTKCSLPYAAEVPSYVRRQESIARLGDRAGSSKLTEASSRVCITCSCESFAACVVKEQQFGAQTFAKRIHGPPSSAKSRSALVLQGSS